MNKRLTILVICLQCFASSASLFAKNKGADDELNLKLRLHKGDKYVSSLKMDFGIKSDILPGNLDMNSSSSFTFEQNILDNFADTTFLVEMIITKFDVKNILGSTVTSYNSDSLTTASDSTIVILQKLKGRSLKYTINSDGKLVRSDEINNGWNETASDSLGREMYDALYGPDGLMSNISQCYSFFTGNTIKTGHTWSCDFSNIPKFPFPAKIKIDYSLLDIGKKDAFIESNISISGDTVMTSPDGPPNTGVLVYDLKGQGMTRIDKDSSMPLNANSSITGKITLTAAGENGDTLVVPISVDVKMVFYSEKK